MKERFELVTHEPDGAADLWAFSLQEAQKARAFHTGFSQYTQTPLTSLQAINKINCILLKSNVVGRLLLLLYIPLGKSSSVFNKI